METFIQSPDFKHRMTKTEADKIVSEINELAGLELYDILEKKWVILIKAELQNNSDHPGNFRVSIDLEPLTEQGMLKISFDYYIENIKTNKPHFSNGPKDELKY
jgi:hypothetical protein